MSRFTVVALLLLFALPGRPADVAPELPSWFPAANGAYEMVRYTHRAYDEAQIPLDPKLVALPDPRHYYVVARGKYWAFDMKNPKPEAWTSAAERLQREGFRLVRGDARSIAKGSASFQKGDGEHATYVKFTQCCNSVYVVETAPNPFHVTLNPPAVTAEAFGANAPIPYLPPIDRGTVAAGHEVDRPMNVLPDCKGKPEPFGSSQTWRRYEGPPLISSVAVREAYEAALRAAGWQQVCELGSYGLSAHFTGNARDIWANVTPYVHQEGQDGFTYEVRVADAGAGLRADLKTNCKAALYGVNFDFNKATLRADAEPALGQLLTVLKEQPKLVVEIGGHTDDVGGSDYNLKLSDERAAAAKQWLVAHGIAASRLTSRGYGQTQPLVPNTNEENRAKNRRVEVKRSDCK